ncbi:MAG: flavin reductase family protein [Hyphomicrobiaceae bacterium]|nr:flavin reductase family protein [Hyphomicrobiaceae bacterium]
MHYDARKNDHGLEFDPMKAIVAPRPIGWISTLNEQGGVNLAPYSFFNLVSYRPHYVMFSSHGRKDSLRNAEREGEFVCSVATLHLFDEVNKTGASVASHIDEMELARLEPTPSRLVKPPRVAKSPASLECRTHQTVELPAANEQSEPYYMVIGEVIGVYIDDKVLKGGRYSSDMVKALGRLGYFDYTVAGAFSNPDSVN